MLRTILQELVGDVRARIYRVYICVFNIAKVGGPHSLVPCVSQGRAVRRDGPRATNGGTHKLN